MGRDDHHLQPVNRLKLKGLGVGRAGHAGQLGIQAKIILIGDRGQGLVFILNGHAFFGLNGLMQALRPAAPGHGPARELIHDHHLPVLDDIVHVFLKQVMGPQGGVQMVQDADIDGVIQPLVLLNDPVAFQKPFDMIMAGLGEIGLFGLFINAEVARPVLGLLLFEGRYQRVDPQIQIRLVGDHAGDDERRPGLVDEDRVHLVNDREIQAPLDPALLAEGHVVAQIIETELVVCAIGNITGIGRLALLHGQASDDHPRAEPQKGINLPHPLGVAPGQIIIDRDHMHAGAGQRIEAGRERGHQGLALARAHLGDIAVIERHAADQLHIKMPHAQHAPAGLAHQGKGLGQRLFELLAARDPQPQSLDAGRKVRLGKAPQIGCKRVDLPDGLVQALDDPVVSGAEEFVREVQDHADCGAGYCGNAVLKARILAECEPRERVILWRYIFPG